MDMHTDTPEIQTGQHVDTHISGFWARASLVPTLSGDSREYSELREPCSPESESPNGKKTQEELLSP